MYFDLINTETIFYRIQIFKNNFNLENIASEVSL